MNKSDTNGQAVLSEVSNGDSAEYSSEVDTEGYDADPPVKTKANKMLEKHMDEKSRHDGVADGKERKRSVDSDGDSAEYSSGGDTAGYSGGSSMKWHKTEDGKAKGKNIIGTNTKTDKKRPRGRVMRKKSATSDGDAGTEDYCSDDDTGGNDAEPEEPGEEKLMPCGSIAGGDDGKKNEDTIRDTLKSMGCPIDGPPSKPSGESDQAQRKRKLGERMDHIRVHEWRVKDRPFRERK